MDQTAVPLALEPTLEWRLMSCTAHRQTQRTKCQNPRLLLRIVLNQPVGSTTLEAPMAMNCVNLVSLALENIITYVKPLIFCCTHGIGVGGNWRRVGVGGAR